MAAIRRESLSLGSVRSRRGSGTVGSSDRLAIGDLSTKEHLPLNRAKAVAFHQKVRDKLDIFLHQSRNSHDPLLKNLTELYDRGKISVSISTPTGVDHPAQSALGDGKVHFFASDYQPPLVNYQLKTRNESERPVEPGSFRTYDGGFPQDIGVRGASTAYDNGIRLYVIPRGDISGEDGEHFVIATQYTLPHEAAHILGRHNKPGFVLHESAKTSAILDEMNSYYLENDIHHARTGDWLYGNPAQSVGGYPKDGKVLGKSVRFYSAAHEGVALKVLGDYPAHSESVRDSQDESRADAITNHMKAKGNNMILSPRIDDLIEVVVLLRSEKRLDVQKDLLHRALLSLDRHDWEYLQPAKDGGAQSNFWSGVDRSLGEDSGVKDYIYSLILNANSFEEFTSSLAPFRPQPANVPVLTDGEATPYGFGSGVYGFGTPSSEYGSPKGSTTPTPAHPQTLDVEALRRGLQGVIDSDASKLFTADA